jgi:double-stranded uracil-DNA glycosylase
MDVLPDVVGPAPRVVFCGMACAESTGRRDHYYAGPGNNFWSMLRESGLIPGAWGPGDEERLLAEGLGLTDVVRHISTTPPTYDAEELVTKVRAWEPDWLAFTSKTVAQGTARALGLCRPQLGVADWDLGTTSVYVLPGTSGANQRRDYDGRPDRLSWWQDLAALAASDAP